MKINKNFWYKKINDSKIIINVENEIKIINCDYQIFLEFIKIAKTKSFKEIQQYFSSRFTVDEINSFVQILSNEKILEQESNGKTEGYTTRKYNGINIIYNGCLFNELYKDLSDNLTINKNISLQDLNSMEPTDKEFYLIILDDVEYGDLLRINRKLYSRSSQYIFIFKSSNEIFIGPHVIPGKTACIESYLTHRMDRINNKTANCFKIEDFYGLKVSDKYEENKFSNLELKNLSRIIITEINSIIDSEDNHQFLETIYAFESGKFNFSEKITFGQLTKCKCFSENNDNYYKSLPEFLKNSSPTIPEFENDIKYYNGGLRSIPKESSRILLEKALQKTGLKINIESSNETKLNEIIPVYNAFLKASHRNNTPYIFGKQESHGKGINKEQAFFSAGYEMFERLSSRYFGEEKILSASFNEVKEIALNVENICKKIINKNTGLDKFDPDKKIDWIYGYSLVNKCPKLVPASMTFLSPVSFNGYFIQNTSSGLASGASFEDSILQGIYELIEHDAWTICQANKVKLPLVDFSSSKNKNLLQKINKIKEYGYQVITRDYTTDIGLPVFRTWIVSEKYNNYATSGFGASIDPEIALERSLTEAIQTSFYNKEIVSHNYSKPSANYLMEIPTSIYNMNYFIEKDIKIEKYEKNVDIGKYKTQLTTNLKGILDYTLQSLCSLGENFELICVDLTKKHIGIPTVRIISSEHLQRIPSPLMLASDRLFSFQKTMGYSNKNTEYNELYMGMYPH